MKVRVFVILLLTVIKGAALTVTNEVNGTFDSASYDTAPYKFWGDYFATYFYDMYPEYTNHIYSTSRSGSSWDADYFQQQEKWNLPLWSSFRRMPSYDWVLANDNGGFVSNNVVQWGTNLFNAPHTFWNGNMVTNEGSIPDALNVTHFSLGCIPGDAADGDGDAASRNDGAMALARRNHTPVVDMWHLMWTNGLSQDITNNRLFGFFEGGHPYAAGHLCMALKTLVALGVETNVGSLTLNFTNLKAQTNHCAAADISIGGGNTLSCTVHFDRMPPAWDVPDGTITNDARNAFVLMPELGSAFRWMISATNLPAGTYGVSVDGILTDIATAAQLAAGRNWFTNYNGPLWAQRAAVLSWKRKQSGCDPVTVLPAHTAGEYGALNEPDLINFQSLASAEYDTYGKRGNVYVAAMISWVFKMQAYDDQINATAQQTDHTLTIAPYTGP